jgi:AraC family transcriptional regulator
LNSNWTIDAELKTADIAVVLMTHGATGPLSRTHRMPDYAISLFLTADYGAPVGRYDTGRPMPFARFGPLSMTPADVAVSVRSPGAPPRRLISCRIDRERFHSATGLGGGWDDAELAACMDVRGEPIRSGLSRLAREAEAPGFASGLLVEGLGLTVMAEIARYLRRARSSRAPTLRGGLAPWQLRRIADVVETLPNATPSLSDLAALCGISPRHLMRAFKQSTGQTITAYAEAARLRHAMRLLSDTDRPLSKIAQQVGFAAASGFSHAFRRAVGEPPSAFRRRLRR